MILEIDDTNSKLTIINLNGSHWVGFCLSHCFSDLSGKLIATSSRYAGVQCITRQDAGMVALQNGWRCPKAALTAGYI